jgi:hypothetical protein
MYRPYGYSGGLNKWRFAQFGNATLAVNGTDVLQQSISAGAFQAIGFASAIAVTAGGTGYTTAPPITFTGGGGSGMAATATVSGGVVTGITLTNPGQGYTSAPVVNIGGPGTGAHATATMQIAPVASIIETVQGFVFLFDTTDPVNGHRSNGWWCSGLYDQTNWVPSQTTQGANGVNVDTPGGFTAARALGTNIVAFKNTSLYYGVYQGPPVIWAFNQISPIVGTPSQECVITIGTKLFFLGSDYQVYSFDGSSVTPIGDEVREWMADNWSATYQANVYSYHDQPNSLIYWYFCSKNSSDGIPDRCLVLNYRTGKFGRADNKVEAALQAISGAITWDTLGSLPGVTTWDTLPAIPYNSPFWAAASFLPAVVTTDNTLRSLAGGSLSSSLTTGWFGDDYAYQYVQGIIPRFKQRPTTCSGSAALMANLGEGSPDSVVTLPAMYDGEIACDFSTRWVSLTLNFTGTHEILGAVPRVTDAGFI